MNVDIYPSARRSGKYLGVPAGTDFSSWQAPAGFDPDLEEVYPLASTKDLQSIDKRLGVDAADVIDQIKKNGWAVIETGITFSIKKAGP